MKSRILVLFFILTLMITALLITGKPGRAQSGGTQPDYSQVDDFINGENHLLRNDDVVLSFTYVNGAGEGRQVLYTGGTNNSQGSILNFSQNTIIPNGQAGCTNSGGCYFDYHRYEGQKPVSGRFFNTTRDTTVLFPLPYQPQDRTYPFTLAWTDGRTVGDSPAAAGLTWTGSQKIALGLPVYRMTAAVADLNNDGYDDILYTYSLSESDIQNYLANFAILTAVDVNNPAKGFREARYWSPDRLIPYVRALTIGDFNGDRQPDIATLSVDTNLNLLLNTYSLDPKTLRFSEGSTLVITKLPNDSDQPLDLAAGNFTSTEYQQIVVASYQANVQYAFVDFQPNSIVAKLTSSVLSSETYLPLKYMRLKAGGFNWASPYDQIAVMTSGGWLDTSAPIFGSGTRLSLMTVDPKTLTVVRKALISPVTDVAGDGTFVGFDIAVGNFDHKSPDPSNPSQVQRDPDLQIALIGARQNSAGDSDQTSAFYIYSVSEDYSKLNQEQGLYLDGNFSGGHNILEMTITAADLQGRSFRLGRGYKVTVDRSQPQTVLAMPPMHADYVSPAGSAPPTILNLSVAPDAFKSAYTQSTSTDTTVTQTDTKSSSFSGEESIGGSVTLGEFSPTTLELENGVKITDTFKAQQELKDSSTTINGSFNGVENEISQETGLSDVIWFEDTSYYLWVYPVIGRKVCPADKPNCQDSDKIPLQLMFSAPLPTTLQYLATDTIEWYQPPWEFGNILSYPGGLSQLKLYLPDINLLTSQTVFGTDDAAAELKTTWSNGRSSGQDVEHEALFTESNDLSIEGVTDVTVLGFGGEATSKLDLNFGGSTGTKSLNKSDTKFSSAQGISITKSAAFTDPATYKYFFSPLIFGRVKPVNYTDPVSTSADLLSYGALRSAFTVDPIRTSAGRWWSQSHYFSLPDVAVNHPNRWVYSRVPLPSNRVVPWNCVNLADGLSMNCIGQSEREPANPWLDAFHDMRGLFITNSKNPTSPNPFVPGGGGAQLQTASDGDTLTLSTRVYNYSFKAMPVNTTVKVRFYGMKLDSQNMPIEEDDSDSFLIGEVALKNPIPPFSTAPNAPLNWVLASTNFDTSGRANQALAFWVVVWMEDGSGNKVMELANHGLTGKPAAGSTAFFEDITKLEEMVSNPLDDDPAMVSFSNNIGFYRSAFHILPKNSASATSAKAASAVPSVKVEKVEVSGTRVKPGKSVEGSVTLRNGDQDLLGVMVYFYDGDPAKGGRLIDLERLGRLRASSQQKVSILFRPKDCGSHSLFVRVAPGKTHAVEGSATQLVFVECPEAACFAPVCLKSAQYFANNVQKLPQGKVGVAGRGYVRDLDTSNTAAMTQILTSSNGELNYFNQQYVTLQLSLLESGAPSAEKSNLLCYRVSFPSVKLSTLETLSSTMTIDELLKAGKQAAQRGNLIDIRTVARVMRLLNGDDPEGRCRSNP